MDRNLILRRAKWPLVLAVLAGGFALVLVRSQALPDGPQPVVWDREVCAECRMSVSDRRFACQLQTAGGEVLDFDDPGCLFLHVSATDAPVHAIYFHAFDDDRWIDRDRVAFLPVSNSPMGYDLAAVAPGRENAMDYEAAVSRVLGMEESDAAR